MKKPDWECRALIGWTTEGSLGRCKAQWQTALGVVMATGLDLLIKLATVPICILRATEVSSEFQVPSSKL